MVLFNPQSGGMGKIQARQRQRQKGRAGLRQTEIPGPSSLLPGSYPNIPPNLDPGPRFLYIKSHWKHLEPVDLVLRSRHDSVWI